MFHNSLRILVLWVTFFLSPAVGFSASTTISMRLLYPSLRRLLGDRLDR